MPAAASIWVQGAGSPTYAAPPPPSAGARVSIWAEVAAGFVSTTPASIPPTYDAIFQRVAGGVPMQLLKSNSWHESGFKPDARPVDKHGKAVSSATGLGQILKATRTTFNTQNHYNFSEKDMEDPEKNAMIQAWLFGWIANELKRKSGWATDWDDPNFVSAVLLAYGAGAERVPQIVGKMHSEGVQFRAMTPDAIRARAGQLYPSSTIFVDRQQADAQGKGPYLSAQEIADNVAMKLRDYLALRGQTSPAAAAAVAQAAAPPASALVQEPRPRPAPVQTPAGGIGGPVALGAAAVALFLLWRSRAMRAAQTPGVPA